MTPENKIKLQLLRQLNEKLSITFMEWLHSIEATAESKEDLSAIEKAYLMGRTDAINAAWVLWNDTRREVKNTCLSVTLITPDTLMSKKS